MSPGYGLALGLYEAGWLAAESPCWLAVRAAEAHRAAAGGGLSPFAWSFHPEALVEMHLGADLAAWVLDQQLPFCSCGRRWSECDGSRAKCLGRR